MKLIIIFILFLAGCSLNTGGSYTSDIRGDDIEREHMDINPDSIDIPLTCGNGSVEGGEECDDGNNVQGDGCDNDCTFSCHADADCDDGQLCNGKEPCDSDATHTCLAGSPMPQGTACDDGLFCTWNDACDGSGLCTGTERSCDDGLLCTSDSCNETYDSCTNIVAPGFCIIDNVCRGHGELNPLNECEACNSASPDTWSWQPDMTACSADSGICCRGACIIGGSCCTDADCSYCEGPAQACTEFGSEPECLSQEGCAWGIGACTGDRACFEVTGLGTHEQCAACGCSHPFDYGGWHCNEPPPAIPCSGFTDEGSCWRCGCYWDGSSCSGDRNCWEILHIESNPECQACGCTIAFWEDWDSSWHCLRFPSLACSSFTAQDECRTCGCDWNTSGCTGTHLPCSAYASEIDCTSQRNCAWAGHTCTIDHVCQ